MANHVSVIALISLSCLVATCYGNVLFSTLNPTLIVTASPSPPGQVLKAGEDTITVTWSYNSSFPSSTDSDYRTVKIMLCYAPESQQDRAWRKTVDNLKKDKTCQHKIVSRPYSRSGNNTFTYTVQRDIPTATYFVRAYALNAHDTQLAYGQTTNAQKTTNLFGIQAITGRHVSLDIASICFSGFSILSLFGFFYMEKRKAKSQSK
ncbi:high-affinity nitrate transporter 3.1 [Phtheirospermum japonicum]|uniref:High-affinity nitrate transporter n=1 Tax=Phtheirospermum japonicum TaxID=374723 RepID=A0A830D5J8_9LAMI|nr:high-affinity nitrate transporter 3.1 [Phtheirospermum japonicum]